MEHKERAVLRTKKSRILGPVFLGIWLTVFSSGWTSFSWRLRLGCTTTGGCRMGGHNLLSLLCLGHWSFSRPLTVLCITGKVISKFGIRLLAKMVFVKRLSGHCLINLNNGKKKERKKQLLACTKMKVDLRTRTNKSKTFSTKNLSCSSLKQPPWTTLILSIFYSLHIVHVSLFNNKSS